MTYCLVGQAISLLQPSLDIPNLSLEHFGHGWDLGSAKMQHIPSQAIVTKGSQEGDTNTSTVSSTQHAQNANIDHVKVLALLVTTASVVIGILLCDLGTIVRLSGEQDMVKERSQIGRLENILGGWWAITAVH